MGLINFQATVVSNNQITIPLETREFLDLHVGDILDMEILRIKPRITQQMTREEILQRSIV